MNDTVSVCGLYLRYESDYILTLHTHTYTHTNIQNTWNNIDQEINKEYYLWEVRFWGYLDFFLFWFNYIFKFLMIKYFSHLQKIYF